jgi:signal transduction histidine kinase
LKNDTRAKHTAHKLRERGGLAVAAYRMLALGVGGLQILVFPLEYTSLVPPVALVSGAGVYTVASILPVLLRLKVGNSLSYARLGIDVVVSAFPVAVTGGFHSPFLAFALTPMLASSLFLHRRMTIAVVLVSVAIVFGSQAAIPAYGYQMTLREIRDVSFYLIAAALTTFLPYLINARVKQQWRYEDIIEERQRLSHELHDGPVQAVTALRWQVQSLRQRLQSMGIDLDELREVERLAEIGQQETRDSLEILRNSTGDGRFIQRLHDYVNSLRRQGGIDVYLYANVPQLCLDPLVEVELLHICQEALSNARRHSGAKSVVVTVTQANKGVEARIADDGHGFDLVSFYGDGDGRSRKPGKGHGLTVMQERAYAVGGSLRIVSFPGNGTQIIVSVPSHALRVGQAGASSRAERPVQRLDASFNGVPSTHAHR